ncbi:hypothetical protein ASD83_13650 [Devosia sp. Root685]|nr:hypothetical protein ASD83_13650 [Devosia sp. Root685]
MKEGRFNFRVAGIIVADGHVLICREDDDDFAMLPGGRVELGEDSRLSLTREIAEELAMPAEIGPMLATSESFYFRQGEDFHELGFFYAVTLPGRGRMAIRPGSSGRTKGMTSISTGCRLPAMNSKNSTCCPVGCRNSCAICPRPTRTSPMTSAAHEHT